jgi:hypothetical protein
MRIGNKGRATVEEGEEGVWETDGMLGRRARSGRMEHWQQELMRFCGGA